MNINDILSSDKNKELIWNILYEQKIFNDIPDNHTEKIKVLFENTIQQYLITNKDSFNDNTEFNITSKNKFLLKELHTNILNYKNTIKKNNISNLLQETKSEYNNEKLNNFNNQLNSHITNFNTLNNNKPPNEIDFSDKNDEPVNNLNMEDLIKQMEKERSSITNTIFNNSDKIDSSYNIQDKSIDLNTDILNNDILNDEIIDIVPTIINNNNNNNNNNDNDNDNNNNNKLSKIDDLESILNIENINFINESKNTNESGVDINEKLNIIIQKLNLLENLILKKI